MPTETVTLRPVTAADAEALAELIIQLYHSEVPGGLRAPLEGQRRLFRYMVEHELASGVRGRFLAIAEDGAPVGSASVRLYDDTPLTGLPPRLLSVAARSVGPGDTLRMLSLVLRGSLVGETGLRRGECFVYSVVVDAAHRGRGVGQAMMGQLEEHARRAGAHAALLRVIVGNERARRLYLALGYRVVSRTPRWIDWLGLPSELMRKELS